jgi:hypothetical protein
MAFGKEYDLDSGFRQNDGVGVDAKARNGRFLKVPSRSKHYISPTRAQR